MKEAGAEFQRLQAIIEVKNKEVADLKAQLILAQRDELTGLPRRAELTEKAQLLISNRQLTSLIFIDLNGFGEINKTISYAAGDSLLIQFGEFLKKQKGFFGEGGLLVTLSRFGGDEFVILLPYTNSEEAAEFISIAKTNLLNEVFTISEEHSLKICMAMGAATTGADCSTVAALLHHAERAMSRDKTRMRKMGEITKKWH